MEKHADETRALRRELRKLGVCDGATTIASSSSNHNTDDEENDELVTTETGTKKRFSYSKKFLQCAFALGTAKQRDKEEHKASAASRRRASHRLSAGRRTPP